MRAVRQEEKGTSVAAAEAGKGRGSGEGERGKVTPVRRTMWARSDEQGKRLRCMGERAWGAMT